ncbi:MAG: PAS domain-containing protein [candidate division Zixibacteria bacterium]|nr:PAS domain-containing protein [candidate division Zixibacteria bacterium]
MAIDDKHIKELKRVTDSYVSVSELAEKLQADYQELLQKFDKQSNQLEEMNIQLADTLAVNNQLSVYLNNILECLDAGVVVFDTTGQIYLFNQAAEKLTGIQREQAIAKKYNEVFTGDEHSSTLGLLQDNEIKVRGEKWFGPQPVGYSSNRIFDEHGQCCGVVEILYDISSEKQLRETIRHVSALAAIGEMAATVAHQVRNPLAGIVGFSDLLRRDLGDNHKSAPLAEKISNGAKELNRIITCLLDYTKKTKPDFRELDIISFSKETLASVSSENYARKIKTEFSTEIDNLNYRFDPILFQQAFFNIAQNACQAMGTEGGVLRLKIKKSDSRNLAIIFTDTGSGFPEEDVDKLFKPFYTTRNNGIGLGLSMVKKVVDFHNGKIIAASPGNRGARFIIELPL